MGLNYDYKIYIKREKLRSTLRFVFENCEKSRSGVEFKDGRFFKVFRYSDRVERAEMKNDGLDQNFTCCLVFKNDNEIWEYYLNRLCESYHLNSKEEDSSISLYQVDGNNFWVGSIDVEINDYHDKIPGTVEFVFTAVTSGMSRLFKNSIEINKFFKQMCKEVEADYGCLFKESEGYRLIWFEGKEFSLDIARWDTFKGDDFIPVVRKIMGNKAAQQL